MKITYLLPLFLLSSSARDQIDVALSKIGLTKETARIDVDDMNFFGGDKYRLQFFDVFMNNPYKIPDYTKTLAKGLLDNKAGIANLTIAASARVRAIVRRNLIENQVTKYEKRLAESDILYEALLEFYRDFNPSPDTVLLKAKAGMIPEVIGKEIALMIEVTRSALKWRRLAFHQADERELADIYREAIKYIATLDTSSFEQPSVQKVEEFIARVDFEYLYTGATDLAIILDSVKPRLKRLEDVQVKSVSIPTPIGDIVISGRENDIYPKKLKPYIIIDLGGNDSYFTGASNLSARNGVSIIIDLGGNDLYVNEDKETSSFAGAILGYSFLLDLDGDDIYRGQNITQGAGVFGVGVLYDAGGNDSLFSYTASQGAGFFGLGILANLGGSDYYYCFQQAQGYGYVKGCGLLLDDVGDDVYVANDSDIVFPGQQTKEHNSSLAQGVGFGKRADFVDGHSLAGGVGLLIDGSGADAYRCGLFGQGCGYWYGVGILDDEAGNDLYHGVWYVQASGAHFAVGILRDGAGDDRYISTMNMSQGSGHDFTVGFLIDESGNDHYKAASLSLGGGNANGMGLFWDKAGDDVYEITNEMLTLGQSNIAPTGGLRDYMLCLGLFVDGGGKDQYSRKIAKNGTFWTQAGPDTTRLLDNEKGIGIDF